MTNGVARKLDKYTNASVCANWPHRLQAPLGAYKLKVVYIYKIVYLFVIILIMTNSKLFLLKNI